MFYIYLFNTHLFVFYFHKLKKIMKAYLLKSIVFILFIPQIYCNSIKIRYLNEKVLNYTNSY